MFRVLITCLALSSALAKAQPSILKADEKVAPVRLLEYRDEPGHFIFVGKSQRQYHVFDVKNGRVEEIPMTNGMAMFDGGSLLLDLVGDQFLFVPSDQQLNYVQGRKDSYLLKPGQAREPLLKRKIQRPKLLALGLGGMLLATPGTTEVRSPKAVKSVSLPLNGNLLFIDASRMPQAARSGFEDELKRLFASYSNCKSIGNDNRHLYMDTYAAICTETETNHLKQALASYPDLTLQEIGTHQDLYSVQEKSIGFDQAMQSVADDHQPFSTRMAALVAILDRSHLWSDRQGTMEYAKSIFGAFQVLSQLNILSEVVADELFNEWGARIAEERKVSWNWRTRRQLNLEILKRVETTSLFQRVVRPLRQQTVEAFKKLSEMGREDMDRLFLLHAGAAGGENLGLLLNPRMMDSWLSWWSANVVSMKDFPAWASDEEREAQHWQTSSRSGGLYNELHMSGNLVGAKIWSQYSGLTLLDRVDHLRTLPSSTPLIQLGVKETSSQAIKKVLTFIVQSESAIEAGLKKLSTARQFRLFVQQTGLPPQKWHLLRDFWLSGALTNSQFAEVRKLVTWSARESDKAIIGILTDIKKSAITADKEYGGSDLMFQFIHNLVVPEDQFDAWPEFSKAEYYKSVVEIYKQLLEDSDRVLKNRDTYLSVLNAAVGLQNHLLNGNVEVMRGQARLKQAVHELGRTIQYRLMQAISVVQRAEGLSEACEILLSPNPYKN